MSSLTTGRANRVNTDLSNLIFFFLNRVYLFLSCFQMMRLEFFQRRGGVIQTHVSIVAPDWDLFKDALLTELHGRGDLPFSIECSLSIREIMGFSPVLLIKMLSLLPSK